MWNSLNNLANITLLTMTFSCSGIPFTEVTAVHSDEPEIEEYLHSAIDRIYNATGIEIDYSDRLNSVPFNYGKLNSAHPGQWNPVSRRVTIRDNLSPSGLQTAVLHELMHALGAHHITQGHGVMSPLIGGRMLLTDEDLIELCTAKEDDCLWIQPEAYVGG